MARRVYYSKPLKHFWQNFYGVQKKLTPNLSVNQIFAVLRQNILTAPLMPAETPESRQLIISGLELWREDANGNLLHLFFLDRQLRTFLEETPLSDLDGVKKFLCDRGQVRYFHNLHTNTLLNQVVYSFALHLPYESEGYAFSLSIETDGSIELYFSLGENGGRMSDKFYQAVNKKHDAHSQIQSKMFRLAINTIAYMNCFPDCVVDGVPQNLFKRSEDLTTKNLTLSLTNKIREPEHHTTAKIPHFRKGHFRILQSDYFTHKKGEIIFVADTMVKGKAKTIYTSPDPEKFNNNDT